MLGLRLRLRQPTPAGNARVGVLERGTAWAFILLGILLRIGYSFHHEINTDEPQHLHVTWSWTQGLVAYRDVFDNHSPLFSMVFAPMLAGFKERPDIVACMRLAMIPLTIVTLWAIGLLARRLFGLRAALWTVAIAGLQPDFVQKGVEYRADVLWMALWISSLAVLVCGRPSRTRGFAGGLLLGAAFATSMKTSILAVSLVFAVIATLVVMRARLLQQDRFRILGIVCAVSLGSLVVPVVMAGFFAVERAWPALVYGVILHNYVPGLGKWASDPWLPLLLIPAIPSLLWCARVIVRTASTRQLGAARSTLFLTTTFYWLGVQTFWPLVTRQDWLPFVPMASALAVPAVLGLLRVPRSRRGTADAWSKWSWMTLAVVVLIEIAALTTLEPVWKDYTLTQRIAMSELLRLTRPNEPVVDVRGEAIYRHRPTYAAYEMVTLARIQRGALRDEIPERAIATGAAVAYRDLDEWPPRGRQFLNEHYIPVGQWRVLGQSLARMPGVAGDTCKFEIVIAQRYTIVCGGGNARGSLDGAPFTGPRVLQPGPHRYCAARNETPIAVVWATAIERGFAPNIR